MALDAIHFPPGKSANILRGAFGSIFRKIACVPDCAGARLCEMRETCPYAQMFEPSGLAGTPSGLSDLPRPFVFRAWHLDGRTILQGGQFYFDLNLFDVQSPAIAYLVLAFAQLAREGLGPRRSRVELTGVWQLGIDGQPVTRIFNGMVLSATNLAPVELSLTPPPASIAHLHLHFVTPTELKTASGVATRPDFGVLVARLRDRLSTLSQVYGNGALDIDFKAFGERARLVTMIRCDVHYVGVDRRSSRSGQVHSIGGFIGDAEYEGQLAEFASYLRAAKWTGVGRQTVWGKGEIEILSV